MTALLHHISLSFFIATVLGCSPRSPAPGKGTGMPSGASSSLKARFSMNVYPPTQWTHPSDKGTIAMGGYQQRPNKDDAYTLINGKIDFQLQKILQSNGYTVDSVKAVVDKTVDLIANLDPADVKKTECPANVEANDSVIAPERNGTVKSCGKTGTYTISGTLTAIKVDKYQWNSLSVVLRQKLELNENVFFPAGETLKVTPQ